MKKKSLVIIVFLIVIIGAMILFNPTKEEFNKKIHSISTDGDVSYEQSKLFGVDKIYESGYERTNFYIFSIYKTNGSTNVLWTHKEYAGKDVVYIGLFRNFIKIN